MALTRPRAAQIYNIDYKQATRVVTITNITLAGGAPSLVDGVSLNLNDRVLVTGQSTGSQNGLYFVSTVGSGANGTWTRSSDNNQTGELLAGTIVMVTEGTTYADTQWKLTTDDPIVIGTTALTFVQNYSANSISSGNSNVSVNANANVTVSSGGTANVLTVSSTGVVVTGTQSVTGNVTVGNILTGGLMSSTGNAIHGNILTGGNISAVGNITAGSGNFFIGNGSQLTGIVTGTASNIANGTSNVVVVAANANVTIGVGGTSNVAVFATTGEYVTGLISASGNITGGNILSNGRLSVVGNIIQSATGSYQAWSQTVSATAAGTVQANAYVINTTSVEFTTVAAGSGAILPVATAGQLAFVANDAATALLLYPPVGGIIDQATANTAITVSALGMWMGVALTSTNWTTISPDTVGTANQITVTQGNGIVTLSLPATVTTTTLSATGNVIGGNITTGGLVSAGGTVTGTSILGSVVSVTANITGGNILTGGLISATGNITGGNITIPGSANISTFIGNVFFGSVPAQPTYYNIAPLNINNSLAAATKVQLNLINTGGGAGAGSGIDFYTYQISVAAANAEARIAGIDDGNYSAYLSLQTKTPGSTGTNTLVERVKIDSTGASVVANITGGNILTGGLISSTGNAIHGNVLTSGLVSAGGTITGTSHIGSVVSVTGNITGNYILGNGSQLTGINASGTSIANGTSNISIATANGNATVSIASTSNIVQWSTTGEYVTGVISATGNITGGNILSGGIISATGVVAGVAISTPATITANAILPSGTNSLMVSPVTINNGIVITVPTGSTLIVYP